MTVQEIFDTPVVRELERSILNLQRHDEKSRYRSYEGFGKAIAELLEIRKSVLNSMFVMDEEYRRLLGEFNDALRDELTDMRLRTIKAYKAVASSGISAKGVYAEGQCWLGYDYSTIHPVQTTWAKKIWAIMNVISEDYNPCYDGLKYRCDGYRNKSLNRLLYLDEAEGNWNDELDRDLTADMHIIYPVHQLQQDTKFSIFDLLWVRNFNTEITVELDSETSNLPHTNDNLD